MQSIHILEPPDGNTEAKKVCGGPSISFFPLLQVLKQGWAVFSTKDLIGNIFGSENHIVSATNDSTAVLMQKQLWTVCKQISMAVFQ